LNNAVVRERDMPLQDSIDYLLAEGCPSIKYRVKSEVLGESPFAEEMVRLQKLILLKDETVKAIIRAHKPNGWLGRGFHNSGGAEVGLRLLCEKGVNSSHPVITKALQAMSGSDESFARELLRVGRILDQKGLGGSYLIRSVIFAYAGHEDEQFVKEQTDMALRTFQSVTTRRSVSDIAEKYREKLVFKPGVIWPSIYHLRLLAFTSQWRTQQNLETIGKSVRHLIELSPIPYILVREKAQLVAPPAVIMDDFIPNMSSLDAKGWAMWFLRMELLSRLGVVAMIPELRAQVKNLAQLLADGGGRFIKRIAHPYFTKWTAYMGLALEDDWKSPERCAFDLTFRSLLILHYSGFEEMSNA
jgi:hypothetical protein